MKLTNKEERIRELLQSKQQEIDTDDLWLSISDSVKQPSQGKTRRGMYWMLGGLVLAGLMIIVGNKYDQIQSNNVEAKQTFSTTPQQTNVNSANITNVNNEPTKKSSESIPNAITEIQTENQIARANSWQRNPRTAVTTLERDVLASTPNDHTIKNTGNYLGNANINRVNTADLKGGSNLLATTKAANRTNQNWSTKFLPTLHYTISAISLQPMLGDSMITVTRDKSKANWLVGVAGGLMTYTSTNRLSNGEGLNLPNENAIVGYTSQFMLTRSITDNLAIQGGLHYSYGAIRYRNQSTENLIQSGDGTAFIEVDSQGTISNIAGQIDQSIIRTSDIQWHQRHQYLDASLAIQFVARLNKNWLINANVGGIYNLYEDHTGYNYSIIDGSTPVFNNESGTQSSAFVNNTNIGFQGGVGVQRSVGKLLIGLKSQSIYRPNNIIHSNKGYQSKITQTGLMFTINYQPEWDL